MASIREREEERKRGREKDGREEDRRTEAEKESPPPGYQNATTCLVWPPPCRVGFKEKLAETTHFRGSSST